MAFNFRYQRVLEYRRHQAEMAEVKHAQSRRKLIEAEAELALQKDQKKAAVHKLARSLHKRLDGKQMQVWRLYLTDLDERIEAQTLQVEEMRLNVAKLREKLIEATRKKKGLNLLKRREKQAWQYEEDRLEEKELNELTNQKGVRELS